MSQPVKKPIRTNDAPNLPKSKPVKKPTGSDLDGPSGPGRVPRKQAFDASDPSDPSHEGYGRKPVKHDFSSLFTDNGNDTDGPGGPERVPRKQGFDANDPSDPSHEGYGRKPRKDDVNDPFKDNVNDPYDPNGNLRQNDFTASGNVFRRPGETNFGQGTNEGAVGRRITGFPTHNDPFGEKADQDYRENQKKKPTEQDQIRQDPNILRAQQEAQRAQSGSETILNQFGSEGTIFTDGPAINKEHDRRELGSDRSAYASDGQDNSFENSDSSSLFVNRGESMLGGLGQNVADGHLPHPSGIPTKMPWEQ